MFYTAEDLALVDEIFAHQVAISKAKTGEEAILLSILTQPDPIHRAFYLSASPAFRESILADVKRLEAEGSDLMPMFLDLIKNPVPQSPKVEALLKEEFCDAEQLYERFPLLLKKIPPLRDIDARPPARSMEFRLRLAMSYFSDETLDALSASFAALKAAGTTPLRRQAEIVAQLEGYRSASAAESIRQEAMLDLAYGEEESLCGGEL